MPRSDRPESLWQTNLKAESYRRPPSTSIVKRSIQLTSSSTPQPLEWSRIHEITTRQLRRSLNRPQLRSIDTGEPYVTTRVPHAMAPGQNPGATAHSVPDPSTQPHTPSPILSTVGRFQDLL
ncbi:unnamed protein product [Cyclocybe aegerita]|uniref:Uncharacterized protein n=1 Tax=Cyclocybe aegerita TaxID=1973307 RepID=A0A8S0VUH3_CYCAE|nr:unnamed protein product [Cyclocybe aegerita]